MSDRLDDLRRQRALVQEQLAWLDREIAALGMPPPPAATPLASPRPAPTPASPAEATPQPGASDYQPDPASAHRDARRGCLLFVAVALALLAVAAVAIYYFGYRDHPVFFAR